MRNKICDVKCFATIVVCLSLVSCTKYSANVEDNSGNYVSFGDVSASDLVHVKSDEKSNDMIGQSIRTVGSAEMGYVKLVGDWVESAQTESDEQDSEFESVQVIVYTLSDKSVELAMTCRKNTNIEQAYNDICSSMFADMTTVGEFPSISTKLTDDGYILICSVLIDGEYYDIGVLIEKTPRGISYITVEGFRANFNAFNLIKELKESFYYES